MNWFKSLPEHIRYGLIVFVAIWFVGWSTGMGGSFWPNFIFSALMGLLAGALYAFIKRRFGRDR